MAAQSFGQQVTNFYRTLSMPPAIPGTDVLNPYRHSTVQDAVAAFYEKYFNDTDKRVFVIGINPGRLGAGATGIAFTDTDALRACDIPNSIPETRELSAAFVYRVIAAYGGPQEFYRRFFVTSICPFGFVRNGVNFNYYDDASSMKTLLPFIKETFSSQVHFGAAPVAVVLGKGKNYNAIKKMNDEMGWFDKIVPLDHPRFVMQYRRKRADEYCELYMDTLNEALKDAGM